MRRALPVSRFWAWMGVAAMVEFLLSLLAIHALMGTQVPSHMSEYAHSRFRFLWFLAAIAFATGTACLTWALQPLLRDVHWTTRFGTLLLWLGVTGAFVLALFPVDPPGIDTPIGAVHDQAALPTFLFGSAGILLVAPELRRLPGLGDLGHASVVVGMAALVLAGFYWQFNQQGIAWVALVQRLFVAALAAWFVGVGLAIVNYPTRMLRRRS